MVTKPTCEKFYKTKNSYFLIQKISYSFGRYLMKLQTIKIYLGIKTTFEKNLNKNLLFFNLKDFIFYKYICKMYKLYNNLQLKIVENQDLYRNKDDFRKLLKQKVLIF